MSCPGSEAEACSDLQSGECPRVPPAAWEMGLGAGFGKGAEQR